MPRIKSAKPFKSHIRADEFEQKIKNLTDGNEPELMNWGTHWEASVRFRGKSMLEKGASRDIALSKLHTAVHKEFASQSYDNWRKRTDAAIAYDGPDETDE
jgi:hypothetical protein